jgi:replicative DNA helicase
MGGDYIPPGDEPIGGHLKKLVKPSVAGMSLAARLGKLPPQAIELEEAVLGALMLERDAFEEVIDVLTSESFYKDEHKLIFDAIYKLFQKSESIDILTVTNQLRSTGKLEFVGGSYYLAELTNRIGSAANIEHHSRIIQQKFILRRIIEISSHAQENAYEETTDVFDLLEKNIADLSRINESVYRSNEMLYAAAIQEVQDDARRVKENNGEVIGIPSGFKDIDERLGGFMPGNFYILAARPAMGKSSLVAKMAKNQARAGLPVAVFSLEMTTKQFVGRMVSEDALVNSAIIAQNRTSYEEDECIEIAKKKDAHIPLYIDDTSSLTLTEFRIKARKLKRLYGIRALYLDYLQLMTVGLAIAKPGNREQEISTISRNLKALAKELDIPIIALAQLSRSVEQRGGAKRPILSDLRESGSLEQDSDGVMFIYRAEYYGLTEDEEGRPTAGIAEVLISKNRFGATGDIPIRFIAKYSTFRDIGDYTGSIAQAGDDVNRQRELREGPAIWNRSSSPDDHKEWTLLGTRPVEPEEDDGPPY